MKASIYLISITLLLSACSHVMDWQVNNPDSAIEELAEKGLEKITGLEQIDLTPFTGKEKQDAIELFKKDF